MKINQKMCAFDIRNVSSITIYRALNFKYKQQECICNTNTFRDETEICTMRKMYIMFRLQSLYHSMIAENNLNL